MQLTIRECLQQSNQLSDSDSPRLDVELLVAHVLGRDRSYLYTWPEKSLSFEQCQEFEQLFAERLQGRPIAHLLGQREFWGLELEVDASTLIPRPDTECLVEQALALDLPEDARVLDLGTGTGAIALGLASERTKWTLIALDKSQQAVTLAERNRLRHNLHNVTVLQSDWFSAMTTERFQLIVSNPPYISPLDPHLDLGDVRFEPRSALVADAEGLADIEQIITESFCFLESDGWLMIEHGYQQGELVRDLFRHYGYSAVATEKDLGRNERVTRGQRVSKERFNLDSDGLMEAS